MPSSPSVRYSCLIRRPSPKAADPPSTQRCATALGIDHAHVPSLSQRSGGFWAAEGLSAPTSACLRVLEEILSGVATAAVATDVARNQDDTQHGVQPEGGGNTCRAESIKTKPYIEHTAETLIHSHTETSKKGTQDGIEVNSTLAAAEDVVSSERRLKTADASYKPRKENNCILDARSAKTFVYAFNLLRSAGELDTLPKCFHMLHAVCILADQRKKRSAVDTHDATSYPDFLCSSPKKRRMSVEGCVIGAATGNTAPSIESDDLPHRTCSLATTSAGTRQQGQTGYQVTAAPLSPDSRVKKDRGTVAKHGSSNEAYSFSSSKPDAGLLPTVCDRYERAQAHSPAPRRNLVHLPLYLHPRTSQVAGLLLGCIESLEAPPPLSDPKFHEKILHALCRVFYTKQPLEGDHIRACGASALTAATRSSLGISSAATDDSGASGKKTASSVDGQASRSLDAYNEGEHLDWNASDGGLAVTLRTSPQEWRQQIVIRFVLVERLLLSSIPALFVSDASRANACETSGTVATTPGTEDGDTSAAKSDCAGEIFFADSADLTASAAVDAAGGDTAAYGSASDTKDLNKPDQPARYVSKTATPTAALIHGTERCHRALRTVRRWVAFLLELEHERQVLCERVLQASEEVQGLAHMLLQGRRQQEQGQQPSSSDGGYAWLPASSSKSRSLLSFGTPSEDGAMTDQPQYGSTKEAVWNGGAPEEALEELELRIRATQQLLSLPPIPPFTRPEPETVRTARTRFERCLLRWREAQERRRQQEEEAKKKSAAAAAAVSYVTERMQEQQQAQALVYSTTPGTAAAGTALLRLRSISHAFYLLGLNPQTATFQMVEQVRKKWRVLLHPDKFVSTHPHLLQQATEAFKAFHVAVTEANRLLSQRRVEPGWSPPPPPPDLTTAMCSPAAVAPAEPGAAAVRKQLNSESGQAPGKNSVGTAASASPATAAASSCGETPGRDTHTSCCPMPTHQFSPAVIVQVSRSKKKARVGGLCVQVHGAPSREGEWPFAMIKEIRVFVLRPRLLEGPPFKLVPASADVCLLLTKSVELTCTCPAATRECNASSASEDLSSACPGFTVEIPALQPVELGVEKIYWVGTQVEGLHNSQSLITWKPITVCLALPEDGEKGEPPHVEDSKKTLTLDGQAGGSDSNASDNPLAANRALLAFLQTFARATFIKKDCSFNSRLQDAIASLKRTLRHRKKSKRRQQPPGNGQEVEECKWVRDEAKHVLLECIERGRKWESEPDKRTIPSAVG